MTATGPREGFLDGRVDTNNLMLWEKFCRDPTFWWDNRFNKRNKYFPDFKHVSTGESLWIDRKTPTWVSAKLELLADPAVGKATTACYKFPHAQSVAGDNPVRLVRLIRDSAESRCLSFGKRAHEAVLNNDEHRSNVYLLNGLIDMYCKCGELEEARKIFDSMRTRNVVSYTVMIQGCGSNRQPELALEYYSALRDNTTIQPNDRTHVSVISACSTLATVSNEKRKRALLIGMEIHSMLSKEKKQLDLYVATCLVDMYCKCGELEEARKIFDSMGTRNIVSYTVIIQGCASNGQAELALEYYSALKADTAIQPNDRTHVSVISACSALATESSEKKERALRIGMEIHSMLSKEKNQLDLYVATCLVDMYCKCGVLEEARKIFDSMGTRDSVSYTSIIQGCNLNGQAELALEYYSALRADTTIQPNDRTHVLVISACSRLATESSEKRERALRIGMEIHSMLSREKKQLDLYVANCLVDMYCKCGELEEARKIFDSLGIRDSASYTAVINGCGLNGQAELALEYYAALRADTTIQPNDRTHVSAISACSRVATESSKKRERALRIGMEIHSMLSKEKKQLDLYVANCLVDMYCKCGVIEEARKIFDSMGTRDSVSYNAIINGCGFNGQAELALEYYAALRADTTIQPNDRTHVSVLNVCSRLATESSEKRETALRIGIEIHSKLSKAKKLLDLHVANCLVDMYCKCGELEEASKIFDSMGTRDSVSYTSIIQGCGLNGQAELALEYYSALRATTIQPDACTYTCVLVACGSVMAIELGREIHQQAKHDGLLENNPVLVTSLVSFYGKCGDVASAQEAFDQCLARDDTGLWNSLIQAYTLQGRSIEALELFHSMGCKADDVTFVTVLNACSHGGLVEKGRQLLDEMPKKYGVKPRMEHYNCVIDMLGRANQLDEAVRVLRSMPFEPGAVAWTSLLGACRKWKNYTIGKLAFERLVEMDPKSGTPYVLMANIFGMLGKRTGVVERAGVVERMRGERSIREPGRSCWTDASSGKVHSFTVGDWSRLQSDEIAAKLTQLLRRIKEEGVRERCG